MERAPARRRRAGRAADWPCCRERAGAARLAAPAAPADGAGGCVMRPGFSLLLAVASPVIAVGLAATFSQSAGQGPGQLPAVSSFEPIKDTRARSIALFQEAG